MRVVQGDVLDGGVASDAVDGQEAVLVALGAGAAAERTAAVSSLGTLNVIRSMQRYHVRRLVVLSAGGTQPGPDPNLPWAFERIIKPLFLKHAYADLRRMETSVRQSELDWTIVRASRRARRRPGPGRLPRGARLLAARAGAESPAPTSPRSCSTSSSAATTSATPWRSRTDAAAAARAASAGAPYACLAELEAQRVLELGEPEAEVARP